jgi:hypothetical protein
MNMESYIRCSIEMARLLRYHGLREHECPVDPSHTLTMASEDLAICHTCGCEWDVITLHQFIENLTPRDAMDDLWRMVPKFPTELALGVEDMSSDSMVDDKSATTPSNFAEWLKMNRKHIWGLADYDGDAASVIGFVNLKGNLVLLPKALENLPFGVLRQWQTEWSKSGLLRKQGENLGMKRPQRLPLEVRIAQGLPETIRLYTFHRRETAILLGLAIHLRKGA